MITLEDKDKIENIRLKYGHKSASHSFLSLFIYEQSFGYETVIDDDGFYATDKDGRLLFPVGSFEYKADVLNKFKGRPVYMMRDTDAEFLKNITGSDHEPDEDNSEYVYSLDEQILLEGHKFQRIRAKLAKLYRENNIETVPLDRDNISDAYGILSKWTPKSGDGDASGAKKALDNFEKLGLSGAVTYLEKEPVAYVCGGNIGFETLMLCSAKQINDIQGLNISTKYEYYKTLGGQYIYVNTESDHGSPGIRMHKNDLRPVYKNEMFKGLI